MKRQDIWFKRNSLKSHTVQIISSIYVLSIYPNLLQLLFFFLVINFDFFLFFRKFFRISTFATVLSELICCWILIELHKSVISVCTSLFFSSRACEACSIWTDSIVNLDSCKMAHLHNYRATFAFFSVLSLMSISGFKQREQQHAAI